MTNGQSDDRVMNVIRLMNEADYRIEWIAPSKRSGRTGIKTSMMAKQSELPSRIKKIELEGGTNIVTTKIREGYHERNPRERKGR